MMQRSTFLKALRGRERHVALAVFVMSLQIIFATAHLSAMAVAAAIGGPTGDRLGFLQICTAEGLGLLPSHPGRTGGGDQSGQAGQPCLLCGSSAVDSGQYLASDTAFASSVSLQTDTKEAPPPETVGRASTVQRAGTLRGPPLA